MAIQFNRNFDGTRNFSDVAYQFHLTAGNVLTVTIPGTSAVQYTALFGVKEIYTIFFRKNAAPTVPGANTVGSQPYNEIINEGEKRFVNGGDVIQLITTDANAYCTISLEQLP